MPVRLSGMVMLHSTKFSMVYISPQFCLSICSFHVNDFMIKLIYCSPIHDTNTTVTIILNLHSSIQTKWNIAQGISQTYHHIIGFVSNFHIQSFYEGVYLQGSKAHPLKIWPRNLISQCLLVTCFLNIIIIIIKYFCKKEWIKLLLLLLFYLDSLLVSFKTRFDICNAIPFTCITFCCYCVYRFLLRPGWFQWGGLVCHKWQ